jgi:hypothetical protein
MMLGAAAAWATVCAQPAPLVGAEGAIGAGWRVVGLPGQRAPLTRYAAQSIEGRAALRLDAVASYGNLVFDLRDAAAPRRLAWSWRIEAPNPAVDLHTKAGDDTPARVCLAFQMPLEAVPFVERQLLRVARSASGEALPAATLCWAWGQAEERGSLVRNPYSARLRTIVLRRQADDPTPRWFDEERDVHADFLRAFGDEAREVPPLAAVIVAADADNTGARSSAFVAGLRFVP